MNPLVYSSDYSHDQTFRHPTSQIHRREESGTTVTLCGKFEVTGFVFRIGPVWHRSFIVPNFVLRSSCAEIRLCQDHTL